MSSTLYLTSTEADSGKTVVALGILDLLATSVRRPMVFRPIVTDPGAGLAEAGCPSTCRPRPPCSPR